MGASLYLVFGFLFSQRRARREKNQAWLTLLSLSLSVERDDVALESYDVFACAVFCHYCAVKVVFFSCFGSNVYRNQIKRKFAVELRAPMSAG